MRVRLIFPDGEDKLYSLYENDIIQVVNSDTPNTWFAMISVHQTELVIQFRETEGDEMPSNLVVTEEDMEWLSGQ